MNAAIVSRTLALIPERMPRAQTGSAFTEEEALRTQQPERIAHLMRFLSWLGPLNPLTKDDLRVLGLLNQYGKPAGAIQAGEDGEPLESDEDEDLDAQLEPAVAFAEATLPPAPPQAA